MRKLSCQEVLDQLGDYLDAETRAELAAEVNQHLGGCAHCRVEVDTIRRTIDIYQCDQRVVLPPGLDGRLHLAMQRAYAEEKNREGEEGTA